MTRPGLILVVEDDPDLREDLADFLRDEGYEVVTAANGAVALNVLRTLGRRPCVVLLDLMMPVMDGWTLRAEMMRDEALQDLAVVVVSGAADVRTQAADLGASAFLTKPFQSEALVEAVRAHC